MDKSGISDSDILNNGRIQATPSNNKDEKQRLRLNSN